MVGLALLLTRETRGPQRATKLLPQRDKRLCLLTGTSTLNHSTKDGSTILILILITQTLSRVFCYSMGNLMTQHDSQRSLVLSNRQQALVYHNLTTRHTPGIHLLVLHEIKLPGIVLRLSTQAIAVKIGSHSISQILSNTLYQRCVGSIRRGLSTLHILLILLGRETQHLTITNQQSLLTSRNGYGRCGATTHQDSCHQRHEYDFYCFHNF